MVEVVESGGSHSFLEKLAWLSVFCLVLAGFIGLLADYFGLVVPYVGVVGVFVNTPFFFLAGLINGFIGYDLTAISIILEFIVLILMFFYLRKLF